MRLTIAARKSDLARLQAFNVGDALAQAHPELQIEFHFRESLGDQHQHDPLWKMPERGVFTEDFRSGLLEGKFDLVVHSWKDLPTQTHPELKILATMARADARDCLLVPKRSWEKARSQGVLRVLSSSPRRIRNLSSFLAKALPSPAPKLEFHSVRGNIQTRVHKLWAGEGDALVVAKAALDRLLSASAAEFHETRDFLRQKCNDAYWMILPVSANPPAAAQGALAIEGLAKRSDLANLLASINDARAYRDVLLERKILASHGGGCHQKIGVYAEAAQYGQLLALRGETDAGEVLDRFEIIDREQLPKPLPGKIWPHSSQKENFFRREVCSGLPNPGGALLVARGNALPSEWRITPEQLVWTSGTHTWFELAARGVWVSGTFDGLGEGDPGLSALLGTRPRFTKLSHQGAPESEFSQLLPTYRLVPEAIPRDLARFQYFYWQSGTQFLAALAENPEIRCANHACGPGHTWQVLRRELGASGSIRVYLSQAEWRKEMNA